VKDYREDEIPLRFSRRQKAGRPKKAAATEPLRVLRIARLMALAIKFQDMVDRREVRDYAEIARLGYVTRARVTQIMNLLLLAPDLQEMIMDSGAGISTMTEVHIRHALTEVHWGQQRRLLRP